MCDNMDNLGALTDRVDSPRDYRHHKGDYGNSWDVIQWKWYRKYDWDTPLDYGYVELWIN